DCLERTRALVGLAREAAEVLARVSSAAEALNVEVAQLACSLLAVAPPAPEPSPVSTVDAAHEAPLPAQAPAPNFAASPSSTSSPLVAQPAPYGTEGLPAAPVAQPVPVSQHSPAASVTPAAPPAPNARQDVSAAVPPKAEAPSPAGSVPGAVPDIARADSGRHRHRRRRAEGLNGQAANAHEPAAAPDAAASFEEQMRAAIHVALPMAVAGRPRGEVEAHLRGALHMRDPKPVLDHVFGPG
ncbi:MAG: hypothetical protein JWM31_2180, partial [Solirubrobacterales bacterium]|nr:hypothetical protein [Solirubrobacterales bacterium]